MVFNNNTAAGVYILAAAAAARSSQHTLSLATRGAHRAQVFRFPPHAAAHSIPLTPIQSPAERERELERESVNEQENIRERTSERERERVLYTLGLRSASAYFRARTARARA